MFTKIKSIILFLLLDFYSLTNHYMHNIFPAKKEGDDEI